MQQSKMPLGKKEKAIASCDTGWGYQCDLLAHLHKEDASTLYTHGARSIEVENGPFILNRILEIFAKECRFT